VIPTGAEAAARRVPRRVRGSTSTQSATMAKSNS
jgi:hypothetical protein